MTVPTREEVAKAFWEGGRFLREPWSTLPFSERQSLMERADAVVALYTAQGMEAAKPARRTEDCGSTEGDSPVRDSGCAQTRAA